MLLVTWKSNKLLIVHSSLNVVHFLASEDLMCTRVLKIVMLFVFISAIISPCSPLIQNEIISVFLTMLHNWIIVSELLLVSATFHINQRNLNTFSYIHLLKRMAYLWHCIKYNCNMSPWDWNHLEKQLLGNYCDLKASAVVDKELIWTSLEIIAAAWKVGLFFRTGPLRQCKMSKFFRITMCSCILKPDFFRSNHSLSINQVTTAILPKKMGESKQQLHCLFVLCDIKVFFLFLHEKPCHKIHARGCRWPE